MPRHVFLLLLHVYVSIKLHSLVVQVYKPYLKWHHSLYSPLYCFLLFFLSSFKFMILTVLQHSVIWLFHSSSFFCWWAFISTFSLLWSLLQWLSQYIHFLMCMGQSFTRGVYLGMDLLDWREHAYSVLLHVPKLLTRGLHSHNHCTQVPIFLCLH